MEGVGEYSMVEAAAANGRLDRTLDTRRRGQSLDRMGHLGEPGIAQAKFPGRCGERDRPARGCKQAVSGCLLVVRQGLREGSLCRCVRDRPGGLGVRHIEAQIAAGDYHLRDVPILDCLLGLLQRLQGVDEVVKGSLAAI